MKTLLFSIGCLLLYSCGKSGSMATATNDSIQTTKPVIADSNTTTNGDTTRTLETDSSFTVLRHSSDTAKIIVRFRIYYTRTKSGERFCETTLSNDTDHDGFNVSVEVFSDPNYILAFTLFESPGDAYLSNFQPLEREPSRMKFVNAGNN